MSRALGMAIEKRFSVVRSDVKWTVDVPRWSSWLECLWHAFSDLSRGCNADAMRRRYFFEICWDGSKWHNIWVAFDEEYVGLRYGSLDV